MKVFVIYYRLQGQSWLNNFTTEARTRESAINKTKRKLMRMYRINEDEILIKSASAIGYM